MALNGSSSKVFASQNSFRIRVAWSATQNIAGNSSTVTAILYLESLLSWGVIPGDATASATSITINGNTKNFTAYSTIGGNQSKELGRHTVTVGHNGDGTKTFSISASHNLDIRYSGQMLGTQTTSGSYTLNTIPRTSSVSLNKSSTDIGSVVRISIKRATSSFTHTLTYQWGNVGGTIATKINYTEFDWTVPNSFLNIINKASSGWGTIMCETFSGNTSIGKSSVKLTTTVPSNIVPTFSGVTITDVNATVNNIVGANVYVQGLSDIKIAINGASGVSGSSISSYTINFDGRSWGSQTANIGSIAKSGTISGSAYVTDSRGRRSAQRNFSYNFLPYTGPTISTASVTRTNGGLGSNIIIKRVGRISGLGGKNKYTAYLDYREKSTSTWTNLGEVTTSGALGVESFNLTNTSTGDIFDPLKSYEFRINIHDLITKATASPSISTASATMSWGKNGVGIGKIHEGLGALEVGGTLFADRYGSIELLAGTDLNSITKEGWYHCLLSATASTMKNTPANFAFSLFVEKHAGTKQTFTTYEAGNPKMWMRNEYFGWGNWKIMVDDSSWKGLSLRNVNRGNLKYRYMDGKVNLNGYIDRAGEQRSGIAIANLPNWASPPTDTRFLSASYENHTSYPEQHACLFLLKTDGELSIQRKTGVERWYINETFMV